MSKRTIAPRLTGLIDLAVEFQYKGSIQARRELRELKAVARAALRVADENTEGAWAHLDRALARLDALGRAASSGEGAER